MILIRLAVAALFVVFTATASFAFFDGEAHLTGDEYLVQRSGNDVALLRFSVSSDDGNEKIASTVTVGPDFVYQDFGETQVLLDFKFRRLITIDRSSGSFSNLSLYGKYWTRRAFLGNNLQTFAFSLTLSPNKPALALDRYWIERANGAYFAEKDFAGMPRPKVKSKSRKGTVTLSVQKTGVASFKPGDTGWPSKAHRRTVAAWLAWHYRVHVAVADVIVKSKTLPSAFAMDVPKNVLTRDKETMGQLSLSFGDAEKQTGNFDFLGGLSPQPIDLGPALPAGFAEIMMGAARGAHGNGPVSEASYVDEVERLMTAGDVLDATLLAIHAAQPYDGCTGPGNQPALCDKILAVTTEAARDLAARPLFDALTLSGEGEHAKSAEKLVELRDKVKHRPDILEFLVFNELFAAQVQKQPSQSLTSEYEGLTDRVLEAFAVDPYNPARYRDIFNYVRGTAKGLENQYLAGERAIAIWDVARVLPVTQMPRLITDMSDYYQEFGASNRLMFPEFD